MIVDTHAHLTLEGLREDVEGVLSRARRAGVGAVITVGIDPEDSREAVAVAEARSGVWATVGVHPHEAARVTDAHLDDLADLARSSDRVVAWGEIGLDYFRDRSPREAQQQRFRDQLRRARELGLPVVIHDREAHEDTLRILKDEAGEGLRGVFHCFSGDLALAREVLTLGFYLSVPGTVTYPRNDRLREVVAHVPLERVLLETDCPFLAPQPKRGRTNEPAYVVHTAAEVARVRGLEVEDVARITTRACRDLFGIGEVRATPIAYPIRRSLYLNVTDRCTNRCAFCPKHRAPVVKGHDLALDREPTADEVLAAVEAQGGPDAWDEVVFCGFGEPLLRLDLVKQVARELRARGARRIRVNTDGLASAVHRRDVPAELAGLVDAVSVSLNAPDAETYERLCRPGIPDAYRAVLGFLVQAREHIPEVTASVVAVPGLDVEACRRRAEELGVRFRVRPYNEVG
ncbi:TatD family hydrolase [Deferrisoma camini]|uniref:TatD family hydrolase n=1 Tax=Deferrisoma camini TaxID=1035120 RepID=UPI00046CB72A|nr:TatD family hydrolase [Deferrisoma camini]